MAQYKITPVTPEMLKEMMKKSDIEYQNRPRPVRDTRTAPEGLHFAEPIICRLPPQEDLETLPVVQIIPKQPPNDGAAPPPPPNNNNGNNSGAGGGGQAAPARKAPVDLETPVCRVPLQRKMADLPKVKVVPAQPKAEGGSEYPTESATVPVLQATEEQKKA